MQPLHSNRYWARADAPGRVALLAALRGLKLGETLRLADVTRSATAHALAEGDDAGGQAQRAEDLPDLVEYTTGFIRAGGIDADTRETELSFSSEQPYERWWGVEILGHAEGEMDTSWIGSGRAPLLADHDPGQQIGIVRSALVTRRQGRARVRYGKSARADQEMQDAMDGVRVNVSVGYEILALQLVKQDGEISTYRVTSWRPLEVSQVSIPADMTVGHGRTAEDNTPPTLPNKEMKMSEPIIDLDKVRAEARTQATQEEQARSKNIRQLAGRHGLHAFGEQHVDGGTPLDTFKGLILDELHKKGSDRPLYQPAAEIGLSEKETRTFSVARYMRSLVDKDASLAPFETECAKAVREAMEKTGHRGTGKGQFIPFEVMRQPLPGVRAVDGRLMIGDQVVYGQRDLGIGSVGAGGAMIATDLMAADFITLLRNATMVLRMGARRLPGLVGNVNIPRQTGTTTMGWVAESGAASESNATFAVVGLTPKTAHGIQDVTRDLLLQGTPAVEGLIRADLLDAMAVAIDLAALHGTGASNQPTGLAATAGIGAEVGGTNGAAPTWDNIVGLETAVANNNASMGSMGYLSNSRVRGKLKRTQKFASTNGQEIWMPPMQGDDPSSMGSVNGYRAGVSNNVSSTLTKGSASGICSAIFFGNWSDLLIGEWGTAELLPDEITQAANRIVRMHVYQTVDVAVRRAQSFSAMLDALTT
jgi:HK97 family phage major capsid protein